MCVCVCVCVCVCECVTSHDLVDEKSWLIVESINVRC